MINYRYKAKDKYGKSVLGVMNGEDKNSIARHLSSMGYIPIFIEEAKETRLFLPKLFGIFTNKVTLEEQTLFTRQLLTLQGAGISLMAGLGVLEKQVKNRYFKDIIKEIMASVEGGSKLSDAMARHPVFSELYVNMIKAGEASGLLENILERLAEFGEREAEMRSKIKSATRYPLITLAALFCAFIVVTTFVIPKFASAFSQFNTTLPLPTRIVLGASFAMQNYWYLLLIIAVAVVYIFIRYINTKNGRLVWDSFKLKVPVFGPIVSMVAMSRFSRTMSILIKSGLPILQVLDMVSRTVNNALISRTIDSIAANVRDGKGISEPMRISGLFPPMVVQMVAIGEDTGKVDELMMKVSEYYDQQSDYAIRNLTTMIEPIFVLVLGAMVLLMALAIFLPMWNLITIFK